MLFIRPLLISLLFLVSGIYGHSQSWINSVTSYPNPANDCDNVSITVNGNLSSSNCSQVSNYLITANSIVIDINISCAGIGLPVITPYSETVAIGILPSGNYSLTVNQYSFGGLQETNSSSLNIGSCCDAISNISPLYNSNCINEPTSFIDGGTVADSLVWTDNGSPFNPTPSALGWIHTFLNSGIHNIVLTAIDSSGCLDSSNVTITVNELPEISLSSTPATCANCLDGEALVSVLSGPPPYLFVWDIGGSSNPLTGLNPGNYGVTLTDGNTCSVLDSVSVENSTYRQEKFSKLFIYPNPSDNFIQLEIENYSGEVCLELYDFSGKFLKTSNNTIMNIKNYPSGIYFLLVTYNKELFQFKFTKVNS